MFHVVGLGSANMSSYWLGTQLYIYDFGLAKSCQHLNMTFGMMVPDWMIDGAFVVPQGPVYHAHKYDATSINYVPTNFNSKASPDGELITCILLKFPPTVYTSCTDTSCMQEIFRITPTQMGTDTSCMLLALLEWLSTSTMIGQRQILQGGFYAELLSSSSSLSLFTSSVFPLRWPPSGIPSSEI